MQSRDGELIEHKRAKGRSFAIGVGDLGIWAELCLLTSRGS